MTTLLFLINAFVNDCPYPVVYRLRSGLLGGRMSGVKSGVLCHSSSVLLCTRGALESKSHQQLDRCMAATVSAAIHHSRLIVLCAVYFHLWLHESHTSAPAPRDTDWNRNAGTCLSETSEVCPWAEMASDWNMVSNQQSFNDQSIDQWRDCFIACLKAKSKQFEDLLWCVSLLYVTVMTFKAYTTAVINKLTYVSFHKVGREQPSGKVVNFVQFCCKFTKVSVCQKLQECCEVWQSYCKNNRGANFCLTVYVCISHRFWDTERDHEICIWKRSRSFLKIRPDTLCPRQMSGQVYATVQGHRQCCHLLNRWTFYQRLEKQATLIFRQNRWDHLEGGSSVISDGTVQ